MTQEPQFFDFEALGIVKNFQINIVLLRVVEVIIELLLSLKRCGPEQNSSLQTETGVLRRIFRITNNARSHIFF